MASSGISTHCLIVRSVKNRVSVVTGIIRFAFGYHGSVSLIADPRWNLQLTDLIMTYRLTECTNTIVLQPLWSARTSVFLLLVIISIVLFPSKYLFKFTLYKLMLAAIRSFRETCFIPYKFTFLRAILIVADITVKYRAIRLNGYHKITRKIALKHKYIGLSVK
jgi:hypothetical protein